jgi:hypothetical protein
MPVMLRDAESARVAVEVPLPRTLRIEIVDTDGTSLAPLWASALQPRDAKASRAEASVLRHVDDLMWRCELHAGDRSIAAGEFATPIRSGSTTARLGPLPFGGRKLGSSARRSAPTVDDRARGSDATLRPTSAAASLPGTRIEPRVGFDGLVHVDGVPAWATELSLERHPFRGRVELPAYEALSILVRLTHVDRDPSASADDPNNTATFREFDDLRYR